MVLYSEHVLGEHGDKKCITMLALLLERYHSQGKLHTQRQAGNIECYCCVHKEYKSGRYTIHWSQEISLRWKCCPLDAWVLRKDNQVANPDLDPLLGLHPTSTPAQINHISSLGIFYSQFRNTASLFSFQNVSVAWLTEPLNILSGKRRVHILLTEQLSSADFTSSCL